MVEKHLKDVGVIIFKNKLINHLIDPIFFFENKFLSEFYSHPTCYEYSKLSKINWLDGDEKNFKKELANTLEIKEHERYIRNKKC